MKVIFSQGFSKTFAKLSRKISNSFYKMIHFYTLNNKYLYLQCKIRHVYMNFRQNFRKKKNTFAISEKNFSRLFTTYPKAYAKETPFMDLLLNSHIYILYIWQRCCTEMEKFILKKILGGVFRSLHSHFMNITYPAAEFPFDFTLHDVCL